VTEMGVPVLKVVRADGAELHRAPVVAPAPESQPLGEHEVREAGTGSGRHKDGGPRDAELVSALLLGDRDALEKLYRRHSEFAFCLAVRLQGHNQDVEDVVHDSFLKAQASLAGLQDASAFRGWLGSIVVNEVRARLRKSRFLRVLRLQGAEPVDLDSLASPAAGPDVRAQLAQVYTLLRLMVTEERIAWTLRFVEHYQLEEVAELCGCSLATVKRRLSSAQRFLEEHLVTDKRKDDYHGGHLEGGFPR
jgi:RNA polymerase sigma-70 factor, ECF subfamily